MKFAIIGISSPTQSNQKYAFMKVLFGFLFFGCTFVSYFIYIFYVASGFMEYVACIGVTSGTFIIFVCFASVVFRKTTIFECIDSIEKLIDTS